MCCPSVLPGDSGQPRRMPISPPQSSRDGPQSPIARCCRRQPAGAGHRSPTTLLGGGQLTDGPNSVVVGTRPVPQARGGLAPGASVMVSADVLPRQGVAQGRGQRGKIARGNFGRDTTSPPRKRPRAGQAEDGVQGVEKRWAPFSSPRGLGRNGPPGGNAARHRRMKNKRHNGRLTN